ncbi:conserved Plasmodium protein, unknown function [Plasmodium reichenowi]|uniref:Uncharacterized protein n=1 Tax=Plasmodium reichenowi TaxID=5854 RepID=A0A2P9DDG1_PLARE|nr:conserved Plasmodium protein, unknown function [Plasmodium reichenowi]
MNKNTSRYNKNKISKDNYEDLKEENQLFFKSLTKINNIYSSILGSSNSSYYFHTYDKNNSTYKSAEENDNHKKRNKKKKKKKQKIYIYDTIITTNKDDILSKNKKQNYASKEDNMYLSYSSKTNKSYTLKKDHSYTFYRTKSTNSLSSYKYTTKYITQYPTFKYCKSIKSKAFKIEKKETKKKHRYKQKNMKKFMKKDINKYIYHQSKKYTSINKINYFNHKNYIIYKNQTYNSPQLNYNTQSYKSISSSTNNISLTMQEKNKNNKKKLLHRKNFNCYYCNNYQCDCDQLSKEEYIKYILLTMKKQKNKVNSLEKNTERILDIVELLLYKRMKEIYLWKKIICSQERYKELYPPVFYFNNNDPLIDTLDKQKKFLPKIPADQHLTSYSGPSAFEIFGKYYTSYKNFFKLIKVNIKSYDIHQPSFTFKNFFYKPFLCSDSFELFNHYQNRQLYLNNHIRKTYKKRKQKCIEHIKDINKVNYGDHMCNLKKVNNFSACTGKYDLEKRKYINRHKFNFIKMDEIPNELIELLKYKNIHIKNF